MRLLWLPALIGLGYLIRAGLRTAVRWHEEGQDAERVLRIQREYCVPEMAVSEPTGRRRPEPREDGPTSRYDREVQR